MRRYLAYYKLDLQQTFVYRGAMVIWLLGNLTTIITMVFVWFSVSAGATIAGYTKNELITYYIVSLAMAWIIGWYPFWIASDIKSGNIVGQILLKPVSMYWRAFSSDLAWHSISTFFGLATSLLTWFFLKDYFVISLFPEKIILMLLSMILAIFVVFGFCVAVSLLAFWLTETSVMNDIFWILLTVFGGQAYPISFLPNVISTLSKILPFRYMFSFPMEIYFDKLSHQEILAGFIIGGFWILFIAVIHKQLWDRGTKIYSSWGQ